MVHKAAIVLRQSKLQVGSESLDLQEQVCRDKAAALGVDVVMVARDPALSAFKIHPMQRPKLEPVFAAGDDLDYVIYYKQSRCFRRAIPDFSDVVMWATKHKVKLVSATQNLGDPTQHKEQLLPFITAWQDEGDSLTKSEIFTDLYAKIRREGRWGGGKPPYGYMSVKAGEKQHMLAVDDEAAAIVREAVRRVLDGESLNSIVADFNRRGIPSPTNRARELRNKPLVVRDDGTPPPWTRWTLSLILRSPAILGYAIHHKEIVLGSGGMPIVLAPALITESQYDQVQLKLGKREDNARSRPSRRTETDSLLLRVAFCLCGSPLYRWTAVSKGKRYYRYKCLKIYHKSEYPEGCPTRPFEATWLDNLATSLFLAEVGAVEITRRVYHRAPNTGRISMIRRAQKAARAEYDGGGYDYPGGEEEYSSRMTRLAAELRELSSAPPAGYTDEPTGETFRQAWEKRDLKGRRQLMLQAGFRLEVGLVNGEPAVIHFLDPDLARRAGRAASGGPVALPPDQYFRQDAAAVIRAVAARSPGNGGARLIKVGPADRGDSSR